MFLLWIYTVYTTNNNTDNMWSDTIVHTYNNQDVSTQNNRCVSIQNLKSDQSGYSEHAVALVSKQHP